MPSSVYNNVNNFDESGASRTRAPFLFFNTEGTCTKLGSFYCNALSKESTSTCGKRRYRVFITRRSYVLAHLFLREVMIRRDQDIKNFERAFYTDNALLILARNLAQQYVSNSELNFHIDIYNDFLVYGRSTESTLIGTTQVFIDAYHLYAERVKNAKERDDNELREFFLSKISIHACFCSAGRKLFLAEHERCYEKGVTGLPPQHWRKECMQVADAIFRSPLVNACFIATADLTTDNCPITPELLRRKFSMQSQPLEFIHQNTCYRNRSMDSYIWLLPSRNVIYTALTIRCTENYLAPFVFLPKLTKRQGTQLINEIVQRLKEADYPHIKLLEKFLPHIDCFPALDALKPALITLVLSETLLKSFLMKLWDKDYSQLADLQRCFNIDMICGNFAFRPIIKELIYFLTDYNEPPLFSLDKLAELLLSIMDNQADPLLSTGDTEDAAYNLLSTSSYSVSSTVLPEKGKLDSGVLERDKVIHDFDAILCTSMERCIFKYGIESEKNAYDLAHSTVPPTAAKIQAFRFSHNRFVGKYLKSLYENAWCKKNAPPELVFAYILQFMDAGIMAISTGTDDHDYIQSVRPSDQAMNTLPLRYARFMPLLCRIEKRCKELSSMPQRTYYIQFDRFLKDYPYVELSTEQAALCADMKEHRTVLLEMISQLYESYQLCNDYSFIPIQYFMLKELEQQKDFVLGYSLAECEKSAHEMQLFSLMIFERVTY